MKKNLFTSVTIIVAILAVNIISGFIPLQDKKPWIVPDAAKNKKNPVAANTTTIAAGKDLWNTNCKSCHGGKGLGDGSKAPQLKTAPGDFSLNDVQAQTDGALFYKISEGRDDMPSFKKKIPDQDDIWNLVVFIRTLKK